MVAMTRSKTKASATVSRQQLAPVKKQVQRFKAVECGGAGNCMYLSVLSALKSDKLTRDTYQQQYKRIRTVLEAKHRAVPTVLRRFTWKQMDKRFHQTAKHSYIRNMVDDLRDGTMQLDVNEARLESYFPGYNSRHVRTVCRNPKVTTTILKTIVNHSNLAGIEELVGLAHGLRVNVILFNHNDTVAYTVVTKPERPYVCIQYNGRQHYTRLDIEGRSLFYEGELPKDVHAQLKGTKVDLGHFEFRLVSNLA